MRISVAIVLILLLLTGCARPAPTSPPETPAATVPSPDQVKTAEPRPPAPASPENELPVPVPLPEGMRRVELAAGEAAEHPGLYFMDVATGKAEGWLPPLRSDGLPAFFLSPSTNERWITATGDQVVYLIRRSDGKALRYNPQHLVVTVGPGAILATPRQGDCEGKLLDEQGKLLSQFALPAGCNALYEALFSPDGKTLAIGGPTDRDPPVSLVTVATGAVKVLDSFSAPSGMHLHGVRLTVLPKSGDLVVELRSTGSDWVQQHTAVRRYTWQGELRTENQFPGWRVDVSPDEKLLAYNQNLGRLGQATAVQKWGADKPLFRVAGGDMPDWLADSEQVLVRTSRGYQLVSTSGAMKPAPLTTEKSTFRPFTWLLPSPDDAGLFLTGATVVDRTGRTRQALRLAEGKPLHVQQSYWGTTSTTASFWVLPPLGKGWEPDISFWITPKVQRPPFPDKYPLQVADPRGECLNLRAEPAVEGKLIRCLPTGTKLALAREEAPGSGGIMRWVEEEWVWVQVVTDKGEQGWVAITTYSVSHAE